MAGTKVTMADGTKKPIEQVKAGDKVLSRDQNGGKVVAKKVKQTFVHQVLTTRLLTLKNGEKIETTPGHRFFVEGVGWQKAKEFGLGTSIVTRAGPAVGLARIEDKHHDTPVAVYNFEVEDTHTYFVGNSQLWAHNQSGLDWLPPGTGPQGFGTRIGSGYGNVGGGTIDSHAVPDNALKWLGPGYTENYPGVFRSQDNLRQFRMVDQSDLLNPYPHVHFESIGRDGHTIVENSHVYLECP